MERDDVISLQDYLVVLKRQRWLVLLTLVVVVVAAIGVSFAQTPQYEGRTEVVVEPVRHTQDASLEELLTPSRSAVETERLVMTSRAVAERAADNLGVENVTGLLEQVRVESVSDTRVVRIISTHEDPARAAAIANAFADAYLTLRRDQAVDELLAARESLEERAADLRERVAELDDEPGADNDTGLQVERDALVAQLAQLSVQISELGDAAEGITGGGTVLTPAEIPTSPVSPRPLRTGALAVVLGLLLGVGLAFLRDHLDDVVRDEEDLKRASGGRPMLGRIPTWNDPADSNRLVTLVDPAAVASEAYRELSAGVRFLLLTSRDDVEAEGEGGRPQRAGRSLMVTSAVAGDGKSSTAANLAVAAARVGLRTVLVDADLRRSTVGGRFGLGRSTGLSDVLLSGGKPSDHAVQVGVDNLVVLTAGTTPPNPNELLASRAMRELHRTLTEQADLVIYDTPAALAVPDVLELGHLVDLTIMVARQGVTGRRQLSGAIERLEQAGTHVGGLVLNGIDHRADGYYYAYYYREPEPDAQGGERLRRSSKPAKATKAGRAAGAAGAGHAAGAGRSTRTQAGEAPPAASSSSDAGHRDGDRTTEAWDSFFSRSDDAGGEQPAESATRSRRSPDATSDEPGLFDRGPR